MPISSIVIPAIVATTAMTAFSYLYSNLRGKQFREPELLNILLIRWGIGIRLSKNSVWGWLIHYFVGVVFLVFFVWIWGKPILEANLISGLLLGFLAGIIGVIGWQITLWVHPDAPNIKFKEYYLHLVLAHVVFGISSVLTFNWL